MAGDEPQDRSAEATSHRCAEKLSDTPADEQYQRWRACLETARPKRVALPLGEFKAPTIGWLIITGRRGHYDFCDTTRAYSLTTGTAFIHDSCSGLALKPGGEVDVDATNKARVDQVKVGTIPVDNLREAVWMILFRGDAEELQVRAAYYPLPAGLTPQVTIRARDTREGDAFHGGRSFNTGQTWLTWRWTATTGSSYIGDLRWPDSDDAAEGHAASLLEVAEEGFVQRRCAIQKLPEASTISSTKTRRLNEVDADAIRAHDRDLKNAWDKWRTLPVCSSQAR